jgi:hypothetical protein
MELVAACASTERSTGYEQSPALTATTDVFRLCIGDDADQRRRYEEGQD